MFLIPSAQAQEKKSNIVQRVTSYFDTLAVRSVDSSYIEVPRQPRRIMSVTTVKELSIKIGSLFNFDDEDTDNSESVKMKFSSTISSNIHTSTGFRLGYRNLNISYAVGFGKMTGKHFSFGTNGNRFGFNINLRNFKANESTVDIQILNSNTTEDNYKQRTKEKFYDPCKINSLIIDAYYVFNHRRFSNAATHSASFIQKRSAGSVILDFSWIKAKADYATDNNFPYIVLFKNTGCISMQQINLGLGYSYNWVPLPRLVVNASFIPRLSFDSRLTSWIYNVDIDTETIEFSEKVKQHSHWKLTGTGRVALIYNYKRWIFLASGETQQFRYKSDRTKGKLNDWSIKANIGWRF